MCFASVNRLHLEELASEALSAVDLQTAQAVVEAWCSWLAGLDCSPCWMPATMGATVGGLYAALNRAGMRRFWRAPNTQLNVVITGGGRGIGKAIAREFLRSDSTKIPPPPSFLTKTTDLNQCTGRLVVHVSWEKCTVS